MCVCVCVKKERMLIIIVSSSIRRTIGFFFLSHLASFDMQFKINIFLFRRAER